VNYHLKALESAGLVETTGTRQRGNFIETLYRSTAKSFVVSPEVAWSDSRKTEVRKRQHSRQTLVEMGDQLQQDAAVLLDRATFDGDEIASAAVAAETHFADESDRKAFLEECLHCTTALVEKCGAREGLPYRVVTAVRPGSESNETTESE